MSLDEDMHHGIDGIYENLTPSPKYLVVDSKFLSSNAATAETYAPRMSKSKEADEIFGDYNTIVKVLRRFGLIASNRF